MILCFKNGHCWGLSIMGKNFLDTDFYHFRNIVHKWYVIDILDFGISLRIIVYISIINLMKIFDRGITESFIRAVDKCSRLNGMLSMVAI